MDIDVYTLGHSLKYFRFFDMYRVAHVNVHLRNAVREEFLRRYKNKKIILRLLNIESALVDEMGNELIVYNLKNILCFLRCFGDLLNEITIVFFDNRPFNTYLLVNYLCVFCSQTLTKIRFENLNIDLFGYLNRSFVNVRLIEFVSCTISEDFKHLSLFFSSIATMNFYGWNTISFEHHAELADGCAFLKSIEDLGVIVNIFN